MMVLLMLALYLMLHAVTQIDMITKVMFTL